MPKNSDESNQPSTNPTIKSAAKTAKVAELNQLNENSDTKREGFQHIKARQEESLKKKSDSRIMHGKYNGSMDRQHISEEDTSLWLSTGDLKGETDSEIISAQIRHYKPNIM
jgi:hypothetical protein